MHAGPPAAAAAAERAGGPDAAALALLAAHPRLSAADRAVVALARAAACLADRAAVDRAASAHGLSLVTTSEVAVAPLLPPIGSTMDDDGEEGDGMAGAPLPPASGQKLGAASFLGGLFPAASASSGKPAAAASSSRDPTPAHHAHSHHLLAEAAGGDTESESDAEDVASVYGARRIGSGSTATTGAGAGTSSTAQWYGSTSGGGLYGAAYGAAAAAAQAATSAVVAGAARATAQMLPHPGEAASAWLVADDPAGGVRYFVVQAPAELSRRAAELTTDLVAFESEGLGARVNRRLYGEATALYPVFAPLVMEHLEAVPHGHVCFGGAGAGGALAVLLQLMAAARGLRYGSLLPAVAAGAPAAVGQVPRAHRHGGGTGPAGHTDHMDDVLEDLMSRTVLEELGLPQEAVRNIILASPTANGKRAQSQPPAAEADAHGSMVVMGGGGAADPRDTTVFRLVGRVVRVEAAAAADTAAAAAAATVAAAQPQAASGAVSESYDDGGRLAAAAAVVAAAAAAGMEAAAAAAAGAAAPPAAAPAPPMPSLPKKQVMQAMPGMQLLSRLHKQQAPRLGVAEVGSIAAAAAGAAASAAAGRLWAAGADALAASGRRPAAVAAAAAGGGGGGAAGGARQLVNPVKFRAGAGASHASAVGGGGLAGAAVSGFESEDDPGSWGV